MKKNSTKAGNLEITFIGIDAHKKEHAIYILYPGDEKGIEFTIPNQPQEIRRMVKKIQRQAPGEIRMCYEAGPCGFTLQRQIEKEGASCVVIAPSLIPQKPGERIKTDRRDAKKLAEYYKAGMLTEVIPPTPAQEAVRDLCRCREAAKESLTRAQHQLTKFLLRRGFIYREGSHWTDKHKRWLRSLQFEDDTEREVFAEYLTEVEHGLERVRRLVHKMEKASKEAPYAEAVSWLRCFRGIDTVTAMTIVTELYAFGRFQSARHLMGYLGMTPGEDSSGERQKRGGITKTGNGRVRRVLVEAAQHQRYSPGTSLALKKRRQGQPDWVIREAEKAKHRLYHRYWDLVRKGKAVNVAIMAVARELAGFIWSVLYVRVEEGKA